MTPLRQGGVRKALLKNTRRTRFQKATDEFTNLFMNSGMRSYKRIDEEYELIIKRKTR